MGCDIHLHIEQKVGGKWVHYSAPRVRRCYALFAKMADVRNCGDIEPISKPKGLPADVSDATALDLKRWDCDGHSHSWLGEDEIARLQEWMNEDGEVFGGEDSFDPFNDCFGYFYGSDFHVKGCCSPERLGIEDVRFVFWFDC